MKKLLLLISFLYFANNLNSQNYFYLSAGNSTIVACNSITTSVIYNINSSAPGLYTITIQPPTGGTSTLVTSAGLGHTFGASAGVYTLTGYDGASTVLGVIHFSVTMATVFDPTITAVNDTICSGGNTSLSFTPVTSNYTISPYNWSTSQTTTSISISPTSTTTYTVGGLFTAATKTCTVVGTKSIVVNPCTGIIESEKSSTFKVYPNPASTTLYFDLDGQRNSELEIIDLSGRIIISTKLEQQIDISSLTNGIYCVKIISEDKRISYSKFVKE